MLAAGADLALGGEFGPHLAACVAAGNTTAARIAQALTRTLTAHFRLGWFDTLAARAQVRRADAGGLGRGGKGQQLGLGKCTKGIPYSLPPRVLAQGLPDPVPYNAVSMANVSSPEHRFG